MDRTYYNRLFLKTSVPAFVDLLILKHVDLLDSLNPVSELTISRIVFNPDDGWQRESSNLVPEVLPGNNTEILLRNFVVMPWCQVEWHFHKGRVGNCNKVIQQPFYFAGAEDSEHSLNIHMETIWRPLNTEQWDLGPQVLR